MAKKERISIFDSARAKVSSVSKSSKDDKEVVYIDGLESKLLELEFLKAQVKDLSAQEKAVNDEIKDISREKFVELYQANKENPNTFLIKDGQGCVMVIPTDSYKKIEDKDRANQLIEEYGEDVITIEEKYYFNPKVLERNMAAVEKLIMDAKTISDDDKRNLLLPDIKYSITKGYIDKLSQYGSKMQTVIDDIQPTIALKNCGGRMEEGGMMGDDFMGNVYDNEEDGTRAINFMKFVVKNLEVQKELENYLAEISNKYFIDYGEQLEEDGYDLDRLFNVSVFADTSIPEYVTSFTVPIDDDINFDIDNSIEEKFGDSVKLVPYYYKRGGKVPRNVGRDWLFKSKQKWEQDYDRKREYKEYKKEGWLANWFKDGGSVINSKRERVIDYYLQNEDNESLVDYYGVSKEVVYDYDNNENTKIIIDAIIKYHNLDNEETVIEKFDNLGLEEFAKGGVARNVGRDWMFKSKQDWEQKYDRKREWKEYKKEGWLANWFKDGGEANFDYGSDLTDESMVKNNLVDGEISADTLKQIVGCELSYPYQIVGAIKLQKCFMRPYYKLS